MCLFIATVQLRDEASIQSITEFLEKFHPPALQDVTVRFRMIGRTLIYPRRDANYIDACLKFDAALSKFSRHRVSFLASSEVHARKRLWMQELGPLFPTLRDGNRLAVDCESSERFGHSNSTD